MRRIGILTGGGDAPGLNAVIRAVVKTAIREYGCEVRGIRNGYEGVLDPEGVFPLNIESVRGILPKGGTILGAANRGNPFARKVIRNGKEVIEDQSDRIVACIRELDLDALIVVGGDGSLRIARELFDKGVPVIGVPKTIDNDIGGTNVTFGFHTAISTATDAIDKLHTTAESHHRVIVLELMGRDSGFIALYAGVAGGADVILIPEIPFKFDAIYRKIIERVENGRHFSIIAASEGAYPEGEQQIFRRKEDKVISARLGGIGEVIAQNIEHDCGVEARCTVLGHLQRGGTPTTFDRWLATRFGAAAVRAVAAGKFGSMVALRDTHIVEVPLVEALAIPKRVNINDDAVLTARNLGICLGDESP